MDMGRSGRFLTQAPGAGRVRGALLSPGLALLLFLTACHSHHRGDGSLQGGLNAGGADLWARVNSSLLQGLWCQPGSQPARDQLSALIRSLAAVPRVPLKAWQEVPFRAGWGKGQGQASPQGQDLAGLPGDSCLSSHVSGWCRLSCLASLAARHGLQEDFPLHPPDLLLFYDLAQVPKADCQAFIQRAAQGDTELLANLPDQRVALRHMAFSCLGAPRPQLSASDLLLLGVLVCDLDAANITTADPQVLQNLRRCPRLTAAQKAALNTLLASGRTQLGGPGSWTLEGLQTLGPLAAHISTRLWMQVPEAVGLDFFCSVVAAYRAQRLGWSNIRCFVTSFLESNIKPATASLRQAPGTACVHGAITAATLRDDLFLVRYDCAELDICLDNHVLGALLEPLLQHPLPAECQQVVKAKLAQLYPRGVPESQLRLITSLVYLYSRAEIGQWSITSRDTLVALLAPNVALENQTEVVLQKFLDHNGTVTGALLVAIGGSRLCWMGPQQVQAIRPSEFRLAGALDISACPQSRKDVLYAKAREAFGSIRTTAAYYRLMRPYLGGAPVEELRQLAQANVSMDIDTFTSLNPHVLQNLSVGSVATLLGPNVGDLQKARSHPAVSSWLRSLDSSALGELGLDTELAHPARPAPPSYTPPSNSPVEPQLAHTSGLPGSNTAVPTSSKALTLSSPAGTPATAPVGPQLPMLSASQPLAVLTPPPRVSPAGSPPVPLASLTLAVVLLSGLLWLLRGGSSGPHLDCSQSSHHSPCRQDCPWAATGTMCRNLGATHWSQRPAQAKARA
ncbi:mesothelin-like protein [Tupaia chinensis]|uniref:mesothelin-like protein n=1 Tax=Tupaia chinensis TaxID=246437 RepID=UPI000FFB0D78|nr:mesothelin-like protein [Tupaia chinensis]